MIFVTSLQQRAQSVNSWWDGGPRFGDPMTRRIFGIAFGVVFLLVFSANGYKAVGEVANALGAVEFAVDVYVALFVGLAKGAFLGLVAAVGVLYLRARRKVLKVAAGQ